MRIFSTTAFCALLTVSGHAAAQQTTINRASAAGLCASALEFVAGARAAKGLATNEELSQIGQAINILLNLPGHPKGEVAAYAEAWSKRMAENAAEAQTEEGKRAVANDIARRARDCQQGMIQAVEKARAKQQGIAPAPETVVPAQ